MLRSQKFQIGQLKPCISIYKILGHLHPLSIGFEIEYSKFNSVWMEGEALGVGD
jgi:hypothetical protein